MKYRAIYEGLTPGEPEFEDEEQPTYEDKSVIEDGWAKALLDDWQNYKRGVEREDGELMDVEITVRIKEDAIPGALTPCHSCNGARTEPDDCGQCPACRVALKDAAYFLAMELLQSEAYKKDPDVERNVDTALHITIGVPSKNRVHVVEFADGPVNVINLLDDEESAP